jgi:biopolymer transport protein ExbD
MKKQLVAFLSLSLVLIFVLSACASAPAATVVVQPPAVQEATSAPATQPAAEVTEAPVEPTAVQAGVKLSDAEMQAFLTEKLKGSPHTLEFILKQEKNAEEWNKTITRMIGNGAKINEEEKQLLIDWLVSR